MVDDAMNPVDDAKIRPVGPKLRDYDVIYDLLNLAIAKLVCQTGANLDPYVMRLHGDQKEYAVVLVTLSHSPIIGKIDSIVLWIFAADRIYCDQSNLNCGAIVKFTQLLVYSGRLRRRKEMRIIIHISDKVRII